MFINENSVKDIAQLVRELKAYIKKQKEYTRLEVTEKLTIFCSTMILVMVLVLLGIVVLFYLSFSLAYILSPYMGGLVGSYAAIAGLILLLAILIVALRKKLIINPIANFLAKLFLNNSK